MAIKIAVRKIVISVCAIEASGSAKKLSETDVAPNKHRTAFPVCAKFRDVFPIKYKTIIVRAVSQRFVIN